MEGEYFMQIDSQSTKQILDEDINSELCDSTTSQTNKDEKIIPTPSERRQLDRFADSLISSTLINSIKITPSGLFIPAGLFDQFLETFQLWLKVDTGSAALLSPDRCINLIYDNAFPTSYYILEGKNCQVGFLFSAKPADSLKNKFIHYAGTPIDGRKTLHPKDPIFNQVPPELKLSPQGLTINGSKFKFSLAFEQLSLVKSILKGSPKLRGYKSEFDTSIRDLILPFSKLILSGQIADKSKLRLIPSRHRKNSQIVIIRIADIFLTTDKDGNFEGGFGLKGKNFYDFVSSELRSLSRAIRNRRIANFEIDTRNRHIAGIIRIKQDKFAIQTQVLLEWIQNFKIEAKNNQKYGPATVFDAIIGLSDNFSTSDWILERDVPPRLKFGQGNNSRDRQNINYRCSKNFLYSIDRKGQLLMIQEWSRPKPTNIEIKISNNAGRTSETN